MAATPRSSIIIAILFHRPLTARCDTGCNRFPLLRRYPGRHQRPERGRPAAACPPVLVCVDFGVSPAPLTDGAFLCNGLRNIADQQLERAVADDLARNRMARPAAPSCSPKTRSTAPTQPGQRQHTDCARLHEDSPLLPP